MTQRLPSGDLVPMAPIRNPNPKDECGGSGLFATPNEYIKILISLLKNDGKLLEPETVKSMFIPQLQTSEYLRNSLELPKDGLMFTGGIEDTTAWNFGLGWILNAKDVDGICCKGTMSWSGLPNLFCEFSKHYQPISGRGPLQLTRLILGWIDPTAGHCGLYASQLMPLADPWTLDVYTAFRKEMFKRVMTGNVVGTREDN